MQSCIYSVGVLIFLSIVLCLQAGCSSGGSSNRGLLADAIEDDSAVPADAANTTPLGTNMSDGEALFRLSQPSGNSFACVTCHALEEPAENGFARSGHKLGDSTHRPHYKNGEFTAMLDAVNSCLHEWMNADTWTDSSPDWIALHEYLEQFASQEQADPIEIQLGDLTVALDGGDADAGLALFNGSCAICHGIDGVGSNQAPQVGGVGFDSEYVARRVRTSGRSDSAVYDGLSGGIMPFWGANRLSDEGLRDLVAYLAIGGSEPDEEIVTDAEDAGVSGTACGSDHSKVGQVATLIQRFHDVSGTATIIDNCTIELRGFNYDGGGIVVEVYAGMQGNYLSPTGFAVSDNIQGPRFSSASLTLSLPEGKSLDDLDGISIWCVDVGISFGDGLFR